MMEYGAINAANLDGGSSSVMVYDGEIINSVVSMQEIEQFLLLDSKMKKED